MGIISKGTATEIAFAYREIDTAEKLLAEIVEALGRRIEPDIRDAYGRHQRGLQLGVPSGENGHRLFDVPWRLAKPVIEAHVAAQRALVSALTEKARVEMAEASDAR